MGIVRCRSVGIVRCAQSSHGNWSAEHGRRLLAESPEPALGMVAVQTNVHTSGWPGGISDPVISSSILSPAYRLVLIA